MLWVSPNTKWQLLFGAFVASAAVGVNLVVRPYRERVCGWSANAALVQLQLTYVLALTFYESDEIAAETVRDAPVWGSILVALNVVCFALFVAYVAYTLYSAARDVSSLGTPPTTEWQVGGRHEGYIGYLNEVGKSA